MQFLKEYLREERSEVLVCDRGLLDGKVYIGEKAYSEILKLNRVTEDVIKIHNDVAAYLKVLHMSILMSLQRKEFMKRQNVE